MSASTSTALSIECLTWINQQLRERAEVLEQSRNESRTAARVRALLVAGLSGISVVVWHLF